MITFEHKEDVNLKLEEMAMSEFEKYEIENKIKEKSARFNIVAKEDGKIIGILIGQIDYKDISIDRLIIMKEHRCKGIGTKLLEKLENYYKKKNIETISLFTFQFQSPEFYKKCGYEIEFIRENKKNPHLTKYFFVKYLNFI
jgi:ribosomal protein S18 acetylase RimI-like enzyme